MRDVTNFRLKQTFKEELNKQNDDTYVQLNNSWRKNTGKKQVTLI